MENQVPYLVTLSIAGAALALINGWVGGKLAYCFDVYKPRRKR